MGLGDWVYKLDAKRDEVNGKYKETMNAQNKLQDDFGEFQHFFAKYQELVSNNRALELIMATVGMDSLERHVVDEKANTLAPSEVDAAVSVAARTILQLLGLPVTALIWRQQIRVMIQTVSKWRADAAANLVDNLPKPIELDAQPFPNEEGVEESDILINRGEAAALDAVADVSIVSRFASRFGSTMAKMAATEIFIALAFEAVFSLINGAHESSELDKLLAGATEKLKRVQDIARELTNKKAEAEAAIVQEKANFDTMVKSLVALYPASIVWSQPSTSTLTLDEFLQLQKEALDFFSIMPLMRTSYLAAYTRGDASVIPQPTDAFFDQVLLLLPSTHLVVADLRAIWARLKDIAGPLVRTRENIKTVVADAAKFDKFKRALKYIMDRPYIDPATGKPDPNSFAYLAGVHRNSQVRVVNDSTTFEYCYHRNPQFLTWHRMYVWKFEQALRTAPGCEDVCLPYWDSYNDSLPAELYPGNVNDPNDPSAMFVYHYPTDMLGNKVAGSPIRRCSPAQVDQLRGDLGIRTSYENNAKLLSWEEFANVSKSGDALEQPHNIGHVCVGGFRGTFPSRGTGAGEMTSNPYAAFDLVFYLHHCNIDRIFWSWQQQRGYLRADHIRTEKNYPYATTGSWPAFFDNFEKPARPWDADFADTLPVHALWSYDALFVSFEDESLPGVPTPTPRPMPMSAFRSSRAVEPGTRERRAVALSERLLTRAGEVVSVKMDLLELNSTTMFEVVSAKDEILGRSVVLGGLSHDESSGSADTCENCRRQRHSPVKIPLSSPITDFHVRLVFIDGSIHPLSAFAATVSVESILAHV
jgi:hypothetical protein